MTLDTRAQIDWQEILSGIRGGEDWDLVDRLLGLWCQSRGVEAAGIYAGDGARRRRVASYGAIELPEEEGAAAEEGLLRLDLPNAVVLHSRPCDAPQPGILDLLLTQAEEIRRLRERLRWQNFQESYRLVELEAVYEVGLAIASTLNLEELAEGILLRAVSLSDARRGALYLLEDSSFRLRRTIGGDARPQFDRDDPQLARLLADCGDCEQDILPGARYTMAVRIEIDGAVKGVLLVGDKESRRGVGPFRDSDRRTLGLFANQAAIALENARLHRQAVEKERLEREMELAADIQRQLLPTGTPWLPGFEFGGWNRPTWQVGGDYYDFLELGGDRLGVLVADVTGKGMAAALLVSTLHSALRLLFDGAVVGEALFARLNEHIVRSSGPNKFITLILAELEPATGRLRSFNAGHNPGLLVRPTGEVVQLVAGGMPVGLIAGASYRVQTLDMHPGDLLCLYSDGITECTSPADEEFGQDRLERLLRDHRERPLPEIARRIDAAMEEFAAGSAQSDDQTLVLLRRKD
ncbi:MAG TPA: SpoIIE family protein phosphatase [Thermoanaerobaculia bacterium]|nr:SpoIIE family protein phosphatase [Thermoanaerobaculia bacterium]